jgi:hypothetical protein
MKGGKSGRPRGSSSKSAPPSPRRGIAPPPPAQRTPDDAEVGGESKKARLRNAVKPKRGR